MRISPINNISQDVKFSSKNSIRKTSMMSMPQSNMQILPNYSYGKDLISKKIS
jgi:hypothetical protein